MRSIFVLATAMLLQFAAASNVWSQADYPNRPIMLVVGAGAGGTPDVQARLFAERLSRALNTPILVENRPGGNGILAAQALVKAPQNGYTLLWVGHSFLTINPYVYKKLPYTLEQFQPVSNVAELCMGYFVRPSLGVNSMKEFVAYMAANPGKVNFGNASIGSQPHLLIERLMAVTNTKATLISYKSGGDIVVAVMGGFVDAYVTAISSLDIQNVRAGKVRALATTCKGRIPQLPEVPTMTELGYPDFTVRHLSVARRQGRPQ
jgi:tripartite-type tricarboxylate transporter receptor subunit TctC